MYEHPECLLSDHLAEHENSNQVYLQEEISQEVESFQASDDDTDIGNIVEIKNFVSAHESSNYRVCRRQKVKYSDYEKDEILGGHMLTDMTINLVQDMLFNQSSDIEGLEDTDVGRILRFSKHDGLKPYIQIIHTVRLHWICFSNVFSYKKLPRNCVDVYDSLNSNGGMSFQIQSQIADFLYCEDSPQLNATIQSVQRQSDSTNCGLFAIAYAVSLSDGHDPTEICYDESKMRNHLHQCIINKK